MADEDRVDIMQPLFAILRFHGLWPNKGVKFQDKLYILKRTLVLISYSFLMVGSIAHILHVKISANYFMVDIIEDLVVIGAGTGLYSAILIFVFNSDLIENLVKDLSNFQKYKKPRTVDAVNKKLDLLIKGFYAYAWVAVLTYAFVGSFSKNYCERENIKYDVIRYCGLLTPTWFPFDLAQFPIFFHIYFVVQVIICACICNTGFVVNTFVIGTIQIFLTRVDHLKELFANINKIHDPMTKRQHLNMCIQYHIDIINLSNRINYVLGMIGFMHTNFTSVLISLLGFQFMLEPSIKIFLHLIGWVIMLLLPCYAGQRLIDETSTIPYHVYGINWYDAQLNIQKDILFIIMRSNKHMTLNGLGFGEISIEKFGNAMQSSYSILALLHQSYN